MKNIMKLILIFVFIFMVGNCMALELGNNITIEDKVYSSVTGWYGQQEDQEVEPGCIASQIWDLEGFFINNNTLTMVGGYDFKDGHDGMMSGDIFIDTDLNASYGSFNDNTGSGEVIVSNTFGYEYAIQLNFDTFKYTVYQIIDGVTTVSIFHNINQESNPWKYNDGGIIVGQYDFDFYENLTNNDVDGLLGDNHYATSINLSNFLGPDQQFISHFTMECGNDNLMGQGTTTPVPEPASCILLLLGLFSIPFIKKNN